MHIDEYLEALGNSLGLPSLRLNEEKLCRLKLGELNQSRDLWVEIQWHESKERLHFSAVVGYVPEGHPDLEAFAIDLLEGNLHPENLYGGAVGIEEDNIVLSYCTPLRGLCFEDAHGLFLDFLVSAVEWRETLAEPAFSQPAETESVPEPDADPTERPTLFFA